MTQLKSVQKRIKATRAEPAIHDSAVGRSMLDDSVGSYKTSLYAMFAATGCVLLIACMNVASLLVARCRRAPQGVGDSFSARRRKDAPPRRAHHRKPPAIETGGALGSLFAYAAVHWLVRMRTDMNRIGTVHIDGLVVGYALGAIAACSLFSGLICIRLGAFADFLCVAGVLSDAKRRPCEDDASPHAAGLAGWPHRGVAGGRRPSFEKLSATAEAMTLGCRSTMCSR